MKNGGAAVSRPLGRLPNSWPGAALNRIAAREGAWFAALVITYVVLVAVIGAGRVYVGYHETDFLLFFVPDAQRLLAGEPLHSPFHPPLYPMLVAVAYQVFGDWLTAALALSLASGLTALVASHLLLQRLGGRPAAWGAALTLLGSSIFMEESARASGDALFLALFVGSCLLAIEAWDKRSRLLWSMCGIAVGLELVTRSSAPPLLLLALVPLVSAMPLRSRVTDSVCLLAGAALPVALMLLYGAASGSTIFPTSNHISVATSFFHADADRSSLDAARYAASHFGSMTEVLLHDPARIIITYLARMYDLFAINITKLVEAPLYWLFLPGAFFLLSSARRHRVFLIIGLVVVAEALLVNLKPFHSRYYLFLVPFLGAAVGHACWQIVRHASSPMLRSGFATALALMVAAAAGLATAKPYHYARTQTAELAQVVPLARHRIERGATLVARKPHLAFHLGAHAAIVPQLETLDQLLEFLRAKAVQGPVYLLYGQAEWRWRPQLHLLRTPRQAPAWLAAVAQSESPGRWVLYRYRQP